jgi:hypothetical protein
VAALRALVGDVQALAHGFAAEGASLDAAVLVVDDDDKARPMTDLSGVVTGNASGLRLGR